MPNAQIYILWSILCNASLSLAWHGRPTCWPSTKNHNSHSLPSPQSPQSQPACHSSNMKLVKHTHILHTAKIQSDDESSIAAFVRISTLTTKLRFRSRGCVEEREREIRQQRQSCQWTPDSSNMTTMTNTMSSPHFIHIRIRYVFIIPESRDAEYVEFSFCFSFFYCFSTYLIWPFAKTAICWVCCVCGSVCVNEKSFAPKSFCVDGSHVGWRDGRSYKTKKNRNLINRFWYKFCSICDTCVRKRFRQIRQREHIKLCTTYCHKHLMWKQYWTKRRINTTIHYMGLPIPYRRKALLGIRWSSGHHKRTENESMECVV